MTTQCCAECDGVGDDVLCARQNNMWRCVVQRGADAPAHRRTQEPLDVRSVQGPGGQTGEPGTGAPSTAPLGGEPEVGAVVSVDAHPAHAGWAAMGRLLGHLGYAEGAAVGGPGVSEDDMRLAWTQAQVCADDQAAILDAYGVDISVALRQRMQMRAVRRQVNAILKKDKLVVLRKRHNQAARTKTSLYHVCHL
jgi:hypothetical protein